MADPTLAGSRRASFGSALDMADAAPKLPRQGFVRHRVTGARVPIEVRALRRHDTQDGGWIADVVLDGTAGELMLPGTLNEGQAVEIAWRSIAERGAATTAMAAAKA